MRDHEQQADAYSDALEDDHPREGVAGARSVSSAPACQRQQAERDRHQADPDPLATAQLEAEEALGEHREEDEPAREHRLPDRDRGERERCHVQGEGHRRHAPSDAPPPGAKEIDGAAQRMVHVDVGRRDCPSVLNRKARFVPSADSSAQIRPTPTANETSVTPRLSSEQSPGARGRPRTAMPTYGRSHADARGSPAPPATPSPRTRGT